MNTEMKLETTPIIHAKEIISQKYLGVAEIGEELGETHFVEIETKHGTLIVAGGACNVGMLPEYARIKADGESTDEALQEMHADLEELPYPSGELLAWHGSLVI
jgi:hypothetical protein